jgi:flagellar biosynthetic protein FlhB
LTPAVPLGLFLLVLGAGAQVLQSGWVWSTERLQWDPARLNPIAGLRRMISGRSLVELAKAFLKIGLIAAVLYWRLREEMLALPLLLQMELQAAFFQAGRLALGLILWTAAVLVVLAAADYAYQRWQLGRDLRMSRQEVKQEQRETEGDPIIRSRIRSLQREKARRRMMQEVPKADVVITNPTHLAVALKYDGILMSAPVVVAKGAGFIAERIREVALENGVPIIENKPLARSLHALVDIGREIPSELYQAVAEILAMILRAKGRL